MNRFRIWTNIEYMAIRYDLSWGHVFSWLSFLYYTKFIMDEHKKYTQIKENVYRKNYSYYTKVYNKKMMLGYKHPIDLENIPETEFSYLFKEMPEAEMEYLHHSHQKYDTLSNNFNHCFPLMVVSSAITPYAAFSIMIAYTFIQKKWGSYMEKNIDLWYKIKEDKLGISRAYSKDNVLAMIDSVNTEKTDEKEIFDRQVKEIQDEKTEAMSEVESWENQIACNKEQINQYDRYERKAFGVLTLLTFYNFAYIFKTKNMFEVNSIAAVTK